MIDELKPKPMNMYDSMPNKENRVDISRKCFAPMSLYNKKMGESVDFLLFL